ncbi:PLDc N-terminal domain-containing protein [Sulfurimonas sp.]|uniref:PLDc N-terminal domain-containing protein n=1 Tax=Sulfurimonas sp. TaxID=2022749 RepID=UPI0019E01FD1|nr:PLDc N-terminal domain-containing protein [Sulfurimonas sp.]MBE0514657.1 PLDc N-terminal domain-containing protein [Sulfurimonas sp.]MDT8338860.1 PLDc N-terminal domain-containing protein [Sulfurimonas sp.]
MSNVSISIFFLFVAFWVYSIISVYRAKFKEEKQKTFWLIGIVFVPPLAFFYLFMKKNLLLK